MSREQARWGGRETSHNGEASVFFCLQQGTQIYDAKKGAFVDIGILDVLQIFGRAGRPQYDTFGEGTIITAHSKLPHYLALLTQQQPIESQLVAGLIDNLNAEVGGAGLCRGRRMCLRSS